MGGAPPGILDSRKKYHGGWVDNSGGGALHQLRGVQGQNNRTSILMSVKKGADQSSCRKVCDSFRRRPAHRTPITQPSRQRSVRYAACASTCRIFDLYTCY